VDHIIVALEHHSCVSDTKLSDVLSLQLERFVAAMQKPFPELTSLDIGTADKKNYFPRRTPPQAFTGSFLGGSPSAPCLPSLCLDGILLPRLPKLLLFSHILLVFIFGIFLLYTLHQRNGPLFSLQ